MDIIAAHAAARPDKCALTDGERAWSWADYLAARNRLAGALRGLGHGAGEHVVVYAHNSLECMLASTAARALGAIPVPMNHRLTTEEVLYILDNSDATTVFASEAFVPMVERVRAQTPKVRHWVLMGAQRRPWAAHLDDLVAGTSAGPIEAPGGLGGSMIYTAGTTGKPKGALRRATEPSAVLPRLQELDVLDPSHVHLAAGPLYHSAPGGFALYAHIVGSTVVLMKKFDPEQALALIARFRCTSTFMAPTLLKRIVELPESVRSRYDVSSMRSIIVAAAPGTPGELHVSHYNGVFDEYWKNPAATAETRRGEWLSVGDVAWMDDEGFVYICDRKRDMIISGGVNIYPAEIEDALHRHPAVEDVAVFGVPDEEWGEHVHAAIQLRPDARATQTDIQAFARRHLADYKIPR